ncbi:virion protein [Colwellia sp. E150_009]
MVTKSLPLGIRNNNPGNIRATGNWQEWQGAIGENQGFIVFDTPENGLRALARTLSTYKNIYGLNSINQIINRWAPTDENDTQSYINHVSQIVGVQSWQPLEFNQYPLLIAAIIKHENGQQPYSSEQIQIGFERGFT